MPLAPAPGEELDFGAEIPAFGTLLGHGLVPHHEVAAFVGAGVERRTPLLRAALHELTTVLWTKDPGRHGPRPTALRKSAATEELSAPPLTDDHRRAAQMAFMLRHHGFRPLALERPRVFAVLRMILAGEERPEESSARLQLSAAIRATQLRDFREIVRGGNESARIDLVE